MTLEEARAELAKVQDEIDALYWAFTRQARAKPPVLVRPDLYERRTELRALVIVLTTTNDDLP